ncbi:type I DNA topoisomerase [bacterium]|nr:type I DNA topoisomerase [bacterium]
MNLIIVESPTKSKTISKFLGNRYKVLSSYGHIRDLPENQLGVDIENNFQPKYIIPPKAKKRVKELKKYIPKAEKTILATDEDREGESIAWHLTQVLKLKNPERIVFHEITKSAIEKALKNPRKIDMNLVNAQQARRVLDRLVGYKLSPFLWKKVARGLSAGRVQSVALRLICEREKEIQEFKPQEYWTIKARFLKESSPFQKEKEDTEEKGEPLTKNEFEALLFKRDGKIIPKLEIKSKKEADKIIKDLKGAEYRIVSIEKKSVKHNPVAPFTTSTLQQEAWKRFHFPAKFTMSLAQSLYETGLITYHRTDSLNLSEQSLFGAKRFIIENYGKQYWEGIKRYRTKTKQAQEAHEAIRPTNPERKPETLKIGKELTKNHIKLYDLIWKRFICSQMAGAILDSTTVEIAAKNYTFRATGQILKFEGFFKLCPIKLEQTQLPLLKKNEIVKLLKLIPCQHFTQPPARYTEGSLVKALEKYGIGRPSTYAPIISTIQERNYVRKDEKKRLQPTEMGILVNNLLCTHFPDIVDINFTAKMEKDLDKIAKGKVKWQQPIRSFYFPFEENLKKKEKEVSKKEITEEKTKETCPICGRPLVIKLGRYGKFYACSGFPECRFKKPLEDKKENKKLENIRCEKCGAPMVIRKSKYGTFLGCSNFPKCKNIKPIEKFNRKNTKIRNNDQSQK